MNSFGENKVYKYTHKAYKRQSNALKGREVFKVKDNNLTYHPQSVYEQNKNN